MPESAAHHILSGGADEHAATEAHAEPEHDPVAQYHRLRETISHLRKGALHRQMGYEPNAKIPKEALEKAAKSSDVLLARRARLALTMESWGRGRAHPGDEEFHSDK